MSVRRRIRFRSLAFLLIGLGALVLLGFSRWWSFGLMGRESNLPAIHAGAVLVWFTDDPTAFDHFGWYGTRMAEPDAGVNWRVHWMLPQYSSYVASNNGKLYRSLSLPLWLIVLSSFSVAAFCLRRDVRPPPLGFCRDCGYNLAGNSSGRCPECGGINAATPPPSE